jgi:hypothetical protein
MKLILAQALHDIRRTLRAPLWRMLCSQDFIVWKLSVICPPYLITPAMRETSLFMLYDQMKV